MARINRAYVKRLEDLIVQLDSTFSGIESSLAKGYLARDMPILHKEADAIRERRRRVTIGKAKRSSPID